MKNIDRPRPTPPPVRPGRAAAGLMAAIVGASVLVFTLVAVRSPGIPGEPTPEASAETFAAIDTFDVSPAMPALAAASSAATSSPSASVVASTSPVVDPDHVATRVRVPDLHIDLPVVAPPKDRQAYPKCGVAMYLAGLHQPGEEGATYLYAHAREGMFLPIYERAIQRLHGGPKSMLGLPVEVYTSDDLRYLYTIEEVRVHQTTSDDAARATTDELWLQTSEGPKGTRGKTQVRALPVGVTTATDPEAHPAAKPVTCG